MRPNYQAWSVNVDDFYKQITEKDKLKFLLNFAVLAPSSHNSQPWSFNVTERAISVSLEPKRRLIESDKNDRQAYISLGCAIENIVVAADYYGHATTLQYGNDGTVTISLIPAVDKRDQTNHLIFSIPKRVSNRTPYDLKPLPVEFLDQIKSYVSENLELHLVTEPQKKVDLAEIALVASVTAMEDKNFREELSHYVKSNITASPLGMPGFGMGLPTPISLIAPIMIKFLNMNKVNHKQDERLLKKQTTIMVLIATKTDDRSAWLEAGRIYERIALLATKYQISTAMWAAPIQIGEYFKDFQKILPTNFRPQAFFRMGYTDKITRHSPRLTKNEVIQ